MFFVQPFVRFAIRTIFADSIEQRSQQNVNKTVKPADETEAIADVIIRESEIAAEGLIQTMGLSSGGGPICFIINTFNLTQCECWILQQSIDNLIIDAAFRNLGY
jgi:hypothetical protein